MTNITFKTITWVCPDCNHETVKTQRTDERYTCPNCRSSFTHREILHTSDDNEGYLNCIDEMAITLYGKAAIDLHDDADRAVQVLADCFNDSTPMHLAINAVIMDSENTKPQHNTELELYEIATGDSVTEKRYRELSEQGFLESGYKLPKLTPKADKLIREKLMR